MSPPVDPWDAARAAHGHRFDVSPERAAASLQVWMSAPPEVRSHVQAHLTYLNLQASGEIARLLRSLSESSGATAEGLGALIELATVQASAEADPDEDLFIVENENEK